MYVLGFLLEFLYRSLIDVYSRDIIHVVVLLKDLCATQSFARTKYE